MTRKNNVSEIKLAMDFDVITLNDLIMLEDESASAKDVRDFLARCSVDTDGNPIGKVKATNLIGNMSVNKIRQLTTGIADQLKEQSEVNPTNGGK